MWLTILLTLTSSLVTLLLIILAGSLFMGIIQVEGKKGAVWLSYLVLLSIAVHDAVVIKYLIS